MKRTLLPLSLLLVIPGLALAQQPPPATTPPPTEPGAGAPPPTTADDEMAREERRAARGGAETTVPREDWGPVAGDKELSISGSGSSDDSFDSTNFSASGDFGWYVTDVWSAGLRQSLTFRGLGDENEWDGASRVYTNWHFPIDPFRPFIGASLGAIYGDGVDDTGFAGLETGAKVYVRPQTFIQARIEYQWFFSSMDDLDNNFDDGAFVYNLGVGYHF